MSFDRNVLVLYALAHLIGRHRCNDCRLRIQFWLAYLVQLALLELLTYTLLAFSPGCLSAAGYLRNGLSVVAACNRGNRRGGDDGLLTMSCHK